MTIDKDKFLAGMAILAGSFGREVDAGIQRAYYMVLNPKLTTEEFERAIDLTISQRDYWPSPAVILATVTADDTGKAHLAFEHMNRVLSKAGGFRYLSFDTYQAEFDAPTKAAISACGGLAAISNTSEERWPGLQKKFAAAYVASMQPALSAPTTEPRVKQLVKQTATTLSGRERALGRDL